uniref:Cytochrome P450 704C1 n=1 Tax=Triticum urartu TaxID=4572 RepID=A0A8R7TRQ6_TRIUA
MDSPLLLAALSSVLLLLLALYLLGGQRRRRSYPPVAGTMLQQLLNWGRLPEYMTELSRRYGTFRMLTLTYSGNWVYTVDPANVEHILRTNFANYGKGPMTHGVLEDLLGDGIFNVDGAKWRHQRKVASFEFTTRALREYSSGVFRDVAAELAGIVAAAAAAGERVDMENLFMRSTLDSIFTVGFGVNLGALSGSNKKGAAFARAFDDASEQVLYRFLDPLWKAKRLLGVLSEAAMKRWVGTINDFVYAVIDKKMEQMGRDGHEFVRQERGHTVEVPAGEGERPRLLRQQVPAGHHPQLRDRRPRHDGGDALVVPPRALQRPAHPGQDRAGGAGGHQYRRPPGRGRRGRVHGAPDRRRHRQHALPPRRAHGDPPAVPGGARRRQVLLLG